MGESSARTLQNRPGPDRRLEYSSSSLHSYPPRKHKSKKEERASADTDGISPWKNIILFFLSTGWIISGLFSVSRLTHRRPCEKLTKAIWITTVPLPCRSFPNNTGCRSSCWSPVFALWGLLNNMTDNLVPAFSKIFMINASESAGVQISFYGAYAVLAIFASILLENFPIRRASSSGWGST